MPTKRPQADLELRDGKSGPRRDGCLPQAGNTEPVATRVVRVTRLRRQATSGSKIVAKRSWIFLLKDGNF